MTPHTRQHPAEVATTASLWVPYVDAAEVPSAETSRIASARGRGNQVGKWLAARVGQSVPVIFDGHPAIATLRALKGRANTQKYYFEVRPAAVPERVDDAGEGSVPDATDPCVPIESVDADAGEQLPPPPASGAMVNDLNW